MLEKHWSDCTFCTNVLTNLSYTNACYRQIDFQTNMYIVYKTFWYINPPVIPTLTAENLPSSAKTDLFIHTSLVEYAFSSASPCRQTKKILKHFNIQTLT